MVRFSKNLNDSDESSLVCILLWHIENTRPATVEVYEKILDIYYNIFCMYWTDVWSLMMRYILMDTRNSF